MQYTTQCKPQKWEIWLAYMRFDDSATRKKRPVLVLDNGICYILSAKITSHSPRNRYQGEYNLRYYEFSGLRQQSTVRLAKREKIKLEFFIRKLGILHKVDKEQILKILKSIG